MFSNLHVSRGPQDTFFHPDFACSFPRFQSAFRGQFQRNDDFVTLVIRASLCPNILTFLSQALWVYSGTPIFITEAELFLSNDPDKNTFLWFLHEVRSFTGY